MGLAGMRGVRLSAGALLLACAAASAMHAQQPSAGESSTPVPARKVSSEQSSTATTPAAKARATKPHTGTPSASKSAGTAHHTTTASGKRPASRRKKTVKTRGQQKIDTERAQSIQEALIREHYLSGEATGKWNDATEEAMRRYQSDHGWQSKTVPDSRALIKLGLGPSHDHLLNPESAMTTTADAPSTVSSAPVSQTSAPTSHSDTKTTAPADPPPPTPSSSSDPSRPQ